MTMQIVVVDTNVLLHFQRLDDVRWSKQFPGPCRFIIPPTVISELDKHKRSSTIRLQRRARDILPWLEKNDGRALREGWSLELRATEPHQILENDPELDSMHPDDRIIATAKQLREEESDADVVLLSDDATPRIKARHHQIAVAVPDEALRLPTTKTQEEQERDNALDRLRVLENRIPKLSLSSPDDQPIYRIGPKDEGDGEARLRVALERESAELGYSCTQEYLDRYADYSRKSDSFMDVVARCIRVPLALRNEGTHHADDILVEIEWARPPKFESPNIQVGRGMGGSSWMPPQVRKSIPIRAPEL